MKLNLKNVLFLISIFSLNIWADGMPATRSDLPAYLLEGVEVPAGQDVVTETGEVPETLAVPERAEVPETIAVPDPREVSDEDAALRLRTERVAPADSEVVTPTSVLVGDGTTVASEGREVTPEEEQERARLAREAAEQEAAAAEARAAAETIRQQRLEEEAAGNTCQRDKDNLISHQRRIFGLQGPQGNKLLDLLKRQDDLKAKLATYQTLLDIWKDYQGFLNSNEELVNGQLQSPASANEALSRLNQLEDFIGANQNPVERYQVAAEVLNAIPNRQAINDLDSDQEKFEYIVSAMETRCRELGAASSNLQMCNINIREAVTLNPQIDRNPRTSAQLINKFVNTAVNIDGADWVWNINFSTLFVDDEQHTNLTGQAEFATTMQSVIQRSKDYCRHQVLLEESENINCLEAPLSQVLGSDMANAQDNVISRLQALNPSGGEINSVSDLTQSYLQMARRTNEFHNEMSGGTIRALGDIAKNIENIGQEFSSAEAALTNPATVRALRSQFRNLTSEKILNLGRSLNLDEFQRNQDLFKNYAQDHPNLLDGPGRLDLSKGDGENKAQFANQLVRDILCQQTTGNCPINGDIFAQNGDDLVLDQNNIVEIFNSLMESAGGADAIKNILGEEQEQGIKQELARVQAEINAIKGGEQYQSLNAFKNFIWEQAKDSCMDGDNSVVVHQGTTCNFSGDVRSGLNDFLQIGDDLLSYQNREDARGSVGSLYQECVRLHDQDNGRYQADYVRTGICPAVFEEKNRIDRGNISRAEGARRGPTTHDPNVIYEYDRDGNVVDRHVPDSNLAIFLPQAAYTINEQLPFYFIQRPQMNYAIDNWRRMGFQQKTANAYWEAQRQSWLNNTVCGAFGCYYNSTILETASPTFGNAGFGFGSTSTIPTTFSSTQTVPTVAPSGTGGFSF